MRACWARSMAKSWKVASSMPPSPCCAMARAGYRPSSMACCPPARPNSALTRSTAGSAPSGLRWCWALSVPGAWAAARQLDEDVQRRRGGQHAAGVHGLGGPGRPGQRGSAELARMRPTLPPAWASDLRAPALWRRPGLWFAAGVLLLVVASAASLDLQWQQFLSLEALHSMGRFLGEFYPPDLSPGLLRQVLVASWETLAMSLLGTGLAALGGLLLALPASRLQAGERAWLRTPTRWLLNALRSIPELVWATLLLISAGLGPFAGTLALACHTLGVLGRLFAEALENAPAGPAEALRQQGVGRVQVLAYASLPQVLPQWLSYTLYRWENNIRAAAVLGVVGAGALGQLLAFHMGLFHMGKTATILAAMLLMVAAVDALSLLARRALMR